MKLRHRTSPLLLLLLPTFAVSLTTGSDSRFETPRVKKNDVEHKYPLVASLAGTAPTSLPDIGTKDAPVDGLDGKPHKGPFVGDQRKKPSNKIEEILTGDMRTGKDDDSSDSKKMKPEDGVMNDPNRKKPEEGTTGTEGGVSEKEKDRKKGAGGKKKPEAPKEAPPLPHSEQQRLREMYMDKSGEDTSTKIRGAAGLEV